ncbi:hypothetical protein BGZ51_001720 [Haplosporangium sp. Z 767]|nr:hypothetical protein BGZ50_006492 [Haplosporangium sp. Z 11]KAF9186864.1 hypothetical protein BGZ51_001720 [Haplosporangium sp. Z 767]
MKYTGLFLVAVVALFSTSEAAPLIRSNAGKPIPDSYIVVLKEGKTLNDFVPKFNAMARRQNARGRGRKSTLNREFKNLHAFSATVGSAALKELLASDEVEYVEEDQIVTLNAVQQRPPNWGLTRVSQRRRNLNAPYTFQDAAGQGVTAYVIDTGINTSHRDFNGRAIMGANFIQGSPNTDQNGHGTHVAGTIGGNTYGVAKKVRLVGVKVLDARGSGAFSGIIAGMDWVARDARGKKAVVNMSLGGGKSQAVDAAAARLYSAGISVMVAAGNDRNADACNGSPSGARGVLTVGASDAYDRIATFSSWGRCVDIFGPGVNIPSAWIGSSTAVNTISGTSMATPHVAGVAALLMSAESSLNGPDAVYNRLIQLSTPNVISGSLRGSANRLLFNNAV